MPDAKYVLLALPIVLLLAACTVEPVVITEEVEVTRVVTQEIPVTVVVTQEVPVTVLAPSSGGEILPSDNPTSRSEPASAGEPYEYDIYIIKVNGIQLGLERGDTDEGMMNAVVNLDVTCNIELCDLSYNNFSLVGDVGLIYSALSWMAYKDNDLRRGEFYKGATKSGVIWFQVDVNDSNFILIYEPAWDSELKGKLFLAIPEQ